VLERHCSVGFTAAALAHAGSGELHAGRVSDADAEAALVATVLGALSGGRR
jgi:hypothetical protein